MLTPCPEHEGAFACSPFCQTCGGTQYHQTPLTRKELKTLDQMGIFGDLARKLNAWNIEFDVFNSGGDIYLLETRLEGDRYTLTSEDGYTCLYEADENGSYIGTEPVLTLYEQQDTPTPEHAQKVAYLLAGIHR